MEKEIEFIKKIYLENSPSQKVQVGLSDLERRISKEKIYPQFFSSRLFMTTALCVGLVLGVASFVLLLKPNKTINAVKATTQKLFNDIVHPNATRIEPDNNLQRKILIVKPSESPTRALSSKKVTPTPIEAKENRENSHDEKAKLPEDVKGSATKNSEKGNIKDNLRGNSQEHSISENSKGKESESKNESGNSGKEIKF